MAGMSAPPSQHLYLVLEHAGEDAYSIHKIDVRNLDPDDTDDLHSRARPLPGPPVLRVEAQADSAMFFVSHGTKLLAMHRSPCGAALVLDTRTMGVTVGPLPQAGDQELCCGAGFVSAGDKLYSMDSRAASEGPCNFQVMCFGATSPPRWSWSSVPAQPPFDPIDITCYAVHPDGRTIFFSVASSRDLDPPFRRCWRDGEKTGATFSFDAEAAKWTFRGYWCLPFHGQVHYDAELDAWVGLHREWDPKGRLCCCDVLPPATGDEDADRQEQAPAFKLARDRLFRTKGKRHLGGAHVYMGNSTFCVVERVMGDDLTRKQCWKLGRPPRMLLYVSTFGLKYGKKGRLQVATCGRRAGCYALPEGTSDDEFFMSFRALWI